MINKANTIIHNNILDAVLCGFFMIVVFVVLFETIKICYLTAVGKNESFPLKEETKKEMKDYEGVLSS